MKFFIKDFFSKCDHIRQKLRIWSHLLKKSLMENFIFCAVTKQNQSFTLPNFFKLFTLLMTCFPVFLFLLSECSLT